MLGMRIAFSNECFMQEMEIAMIVFVQGMRIAMNVCAGNENCFVRGM